MGKLDVSRMANSTKVNRIDDQHVELETALEEIFGIPDNVEITTPIFGVNPDGGYPVQPDGTIRGVMSLKSAAVATIPENAVGFMFDDGTVKKLLVFVQSSMRIYKDDNYPEEDWVLVTNIESPGSGLLTDLTDYTGPAVEDLGDHIGEILKVNSTGDGFDLQPSAVSEGIDTFIELQDGPGDYGVAGQILKTNGTSAVIWGDAPSQVQTFMMLMKAVSVGAWPAEEWVDIYNWDLYDPSGAGLSITDESTYFDDDGAKADKYITGLEEGMYEINFWYETLANVERVEGTREWRITAASGVSGPATLGVQDRASCGWLPGSLSPTPIDGVKYLGATLVYIVPGYSGMKFQVKQTSAASIGTQSKPVTFYATIRRVR